MSTGRTRPCSSCACPGFLPAIGRPFLPSEVRDREAVPSPPQTERCRPQHAEGGEHVQIAHPPAQGTESAQPVDRTDEHHRRETSGPRLDRDPCLPQETKG